LFLWSDLFRQKDWKSGRGEVWCECLLVNSPTDNREIVCYTKSSFIVGYTSLDSGALRKSSFDEVVSFLSD
jgi:hypothetical protein